jgi:hypothetical protein
MPMRAKRLSSLDNRTPARQPVSHQYTLVFSPDSFAAGAFVSDIFARMVREVSMP